jgi:hypothetical protein
MSLSKRDVLLALMALTPAAGGMPALAQTTTELDLSAGRAIGEAYLAANPGIDLAALRSNLLPNGFSPDSVLSLRQRAAGDFRAARVFIFKGWRISQTEARLFALLT